MHIIGTYRDIYRSMLRWYCYCSAICKAMVQDRKMPGCSFELMHGLLDDSPKQMAIVYQEGCRVGQEGPSHTCIFARAARRLLRCRLSLDGAWCSSASSSSRLASPNGLSEASVRASRGTRNVYARSGSHSTDTAPQQQWMAPIIQTHMNRKMCFLLPNEL